MLEYVTKTMKVKPENIILHGYSLGGAVASKVAADFTQEQQKLALAEGRTPKKLGGFVLHSATDKTSNVATRLLCGVFGLGGWAFGGGYNTISHMQRLHKLDPDIPVHYISGSKDATDDYDRPDPDHLSLEITKLHEDPKAMFHNSSVHIGFESHTGVNLRKIDVLPLVKEGRNAHLGDRGRALEQAAPEEDLQAQA